MCLSYVDKHVNTRICGPYGWKLFSSHHGKLRSVYKGLQKCLRQHVWINEKFYREQMHQDTLHTEMDQDPYPTGWHIYPYQGPALLNKYEDRVMRRVEYREVLATGRFMVADVIVARFIRIGGPRKRK